MAYIGKQPVVGNFVKLDAITTSATATYNLTNGGVAFSPQSPNHCIVSLNGVIQSPTTSFTISGSTIVFASALTSADVIDFILVLGDVLNIGTPSDATVTFPKVTSNLITGATAETTIAGDDQILIYDDSATALRKMTRTNFVSGLGSGFDTQLLHLRDERSSGTSVTRTSGSFEKTVLNTIKVNEISSASVSSSVITLPSGTYFIDGFVVITNPFAACALRLRNTSDSTDAVIGSSGHFGSGVNSNYLTFMKGRFTISSSKNFEVQHRTSTTAGAFGNGFQTEVYADMCIWKVA